MPSRVSFPLSPVVRSGDPDGVNQTEVNTRLQQAMTLHRQGRLPEAERLYREVLVAHPRHPAGLHLLGVLAHQAGKHAEAVRLIRASLLIDPSEAGAWSNCGEALRALKHYGEAETCYREAVARAPTNASFWGNLGIVLHHLERSSEAEAALRHALLLQPNYTKGWYNLGNVLRSASRFDEADHAIQQALRLEPQMAEAWNILGALRRKQARLVEAESAYRKALALRPGFFEALSNLGSCLKDAGRLLEAEAAYRDVLARSPEFPDALSGLASVLRESGRSLDARQGYLEALRVTPGDRRVFSSLLFTEASIAEKPDPAHFVHAQQWGMDAMKPPLHKGPVAAVVGRPLRVGYLSSDYRHHAVARFVLSLFAAHDRSRIELFAYSNVGLADATTEAIRSHVAHWHPVFALSDADAADLIRSHRLDLLIDLNGHTRDSRLDILGYKPAPVQAVYLGYLGTTGLPAVDYWITDSILHPEGCGELAVEKLWRLPRCWIAYGAPPDSPEVGLPESPQLTLGSYNHLAKIGDPTIELWCAVLRALPEARLSLKTRHLGDLGTQALVRTAFGSRGIAPERLLLAGHTSGLTEHLRVYRDLDFALDPYPYNGGTTTCDSLWMGVPVLTLKGATMPSRMSTSMLTSVGLPDWIASSPTDFVERAVRHALAWTALPVAEKRASRIAVRAKASTSPLFDSVDLARALETAYEGMLKAASIGAR